MRHYHVNFWSADRAHIVGCDIAADDGRGLLEGLAMAGGYALRLRGQSLPTRPRLPRLRLSATEIGWLAFASGPLWLFVIATYWLG